MQRLAWKFGTRHLCRPVRHYNHSRARLLPWAECHSRLSSTSAAASASSSKSTTTSSSTSKSTTSSSSKSKKCKSKTPAATTVPEWRDFTPSVRTVLLAVRKLGPSVPPSVLLRGIQGGMLEQPALSSNDIVSHPTRYYRELIALLLQEGYLLEKRKMPKGQKQFSQRQTFYRLAERGHETVRAFLTPNSALEVLLPVSAALQAIDQAQHEQRAFYIQQGCRLTMAEMQVMETIALQTHVQWQDYYNKASGDQPALDVLLQSLRQWRTAEGLDETVKDATLLHIALVVATAESVLILDKLPVLLQDPTSAKSINQTLGEAVIDRLHQQLAQWIRKHLFQITDTLDAPMVLVDLPERPPWPYAQYFSFAKSSWEHTYALYLDRFRTKPTFVAQRISSSRIMPVLTICCHFLDAIIHGKAVDMRHVGLRPVPTHRHWRQLQNAEYLLRLHIPGDPRCSGRQGREVALYDLLRPILGDFLLDVRPLERSMTDNALLLDWTQRVRWYLALRRAGIVPQFAFPKVESDDE